MSEDDVDFRMPLALSCVVLAQVQNPHGIQMILKPYMACIQWEDVIGVEEFMKYEILPMNEQQRPLTIILTKNDRVYWVCSPFNEVTELWRQYKLWKYTYNLYDLFKPN